MTTILGMTVAGVLFVLVTMGLFAWAVYMGLMGILAEMPEFREGLHAPGAEGTYDTRLMTHKEKTRKAA